MTHTHIIKNGKARMHSSGLRCLGPRIKQPWEDCNKLIAKTNSAGQLAGAFKCERCGQQIEVEINEKP